MPIAPRPLIESLEPRQFLSAAVPAPLALIDPQVPTTLQAARQAARLSAHDARQPHPIPTTNPSIPSPAKTAFTPVPTSAPADSSASTPATQSTAPVLITPSPVPDVQPPTIITGTGFTGPTPQPAQIGAGFGAKDLAIARFDVVPYQTFSTNFYAGVVAFHSNGIAKVSFSANGSPWTDVTQMTLNPQTGVNEYTVTLNPKFFRDGPVELRAIAYPTVGTPRVLDPLFLNSDGFHTLPTLTRFVSPTGSDTTGDGSQSKPFATLVKAAWDIQQFSPTHTADNGTIYLQAGSYNYGTSVWPMYPATGTGWLTITPAPGVPTSAVRLVTGTPDGLRTSLVHLSGLTIAPASGIVLFANGPQVDSLWIDKCTLVGTGRTVNQPWTNGWSQQFITDSDVSNSRDGLISATLARNVNVHDIGSDAFTDSLLIVNCTASNIDSTGTSFHPDVVQYFATSDNAIIYGLNATTGIAAEGLFIKTPTATASNIAWVNCNVNNQSPSPTVMQVFQVWNAITNLYVLNSTFVGPSFFTINASFDATDVVVANTTFSAGKTGPGIAPGIIYE